MHQYAYHVKGGTIYSSVHLEWYKNGVNYKYKKANDSEKRILIHEGYIFPLHFLQGLPYLPMHPYSLIQLDTLSHVILPSDTDWVTSVFYSTKAQDYKLFDTVLDSSKIESRGPFDMNGYYVGRTIVQHTELCYFDSITYDKDYEFTIDRCVRHAANMQVHDHNLLPYNLVQIS